MASNLIEEARRARSELQGRVERNLNQAAKQRGRLRFESKTRKSAETRQKIMDVASGLMVERGNTTFQMSEVSKLCGMSKGALYYYFSDKDDLVSAIYEAEMKDLVSAIDAAVEKAETSVEALRDTCNEFARRVHNGTPLAMAVVHELVVGNGNTSMVDDTRIAHIVRVVARQLELAKQEGAVKQDVDTGLISVAVCGAFTFAAMGEADQSADDFASKLFGFVVKGIGA